MQGELSKLVLINAGVNGTRAVVLLVHCYTQDMATSVQYTGYGNPFQFIDIKTHYFPSTHRNMLIFKLRI